MAEIKTTYINSVPASLRFKISSSKSVYEYLRNIPHFFDNIDYVECFYCLFLNRANHALGVKLISQGGSSATVADPKIIYQNALKVNASSLIIAHNHPSGEVTPSEADKNLTKKIQQAGEVLDIALVDHLIIARHNYFSFADEGII
jgi:DNA repair protein RadC